MWKILRKILFDRRSQCNKQGNLGKTREDTQGWNARGHGIQETIKMGKSDEIGHIQGGMTVE